MPIYEYACPKCGQFELMRRISDPVLKKCPTCKRVVKKLISNSSFQLKGTGWYVTDYARKSSGGDTSSKSEGSGSGEAASTDSKSKTETTSTAKADSKPDSKSDSKSEKKSKASDSGKTSAAA